MVTKSTSQTRTILWTVVGLLLIGLAVWASSWTRSSLAPHGTRRITFQVEASGGYANITLKAGNVVIDQPQTVTTPWERMIEVSQSESVFLTASNPTQTGQLTCRILLDRDPWKTESIPAPKDGVACAGIVP